MEASPLPPCKSQVVATPLADTCAGFAPAVVIGAASDTASPLVAAAASLGMQKLGGTSC